MKHTRSIIFIFLISILCLSTEVAMAQLQATPEPFDNGVGTSGSAVQPAVEDEGPDPCTSPDVLCPIDGGLAILIAAGIGLAGLRFYRMKLAV